jgi:hypothetical protein
MSEIAARRLPDNTLPEHPGEFSWHVDVRDGVRRIAMQLPCNHMHMVPVTGNGVIWQWDGNENAPTLTPSLSCKGGRDTQSEMWHGHMTAGEMRSV